MPTFSQQELFTLAKHLRNCPLACAHQLAAALQDVAECGEPIKISTLTETARIEARLAATKHWRDKGYSLADAVIISSAKWHYDPNARADYLTRLPAGITPADLL